MSQIPALRDWGGSVVPLPHACPNFEDVVSSLAFKAWLALLPTLSGGFAMVGVVGGVFASPRCALMLADGLYLWRVILE